MFVNYTYKIKKIVSLPLNEKSNTYHIMKKIFSLITVIALAAMMTVQAQDRKPDWARWHYLSEEEMNTPVRAVNFTETPPPTGTPRFV